VCVCVTTLHLETSTIRWPRPELRPRATKTKTFINLILMDPYNLDYSVEISTRCSFVIEFIIPKFFKGSTCFERHTAHHQEL
jgi:hypothetical protein